MSHLVFYFSITLLPLFPLTYAPGHILLSLAVARAVSGTQRHRRQAEHPTGAAPFALALLPF